MKKQRLLLFVLALFLFSTAGYRLHAQGSGFAAEGPPGGENADSLNEEGVESAQQGKYDRAIKRFESAVTVQDRNVAISYNNLAYTYFLAGDKEAAIENYRHAIQRNPNLVPALSNLGRLLYEKEEFAEAVDYGERVLSIDPSNPEVRRWLPDAYRKAAEKRMLTLEAERAATLPQAQPGAGATAATTSIKPPSTVAIDSYGEFYILNGERKPQQFQKDMPYRLPYFIDADLWPSNEVQIVFKFSSAPAGLYFPYILDYEEHLEIRFHSKGMFYGLGVHFAQANFSHDEILSYGEFIVNDKYPRRSDLKLGFALGSKGEFSTFLFQLYPRYLFSDPRSGPESIEFDRLLTNLEYRLILPEDKGRPIIPWHTEFALAFSMDETFVTEYSAGAGGEDLAHYFGTYDVYVDFSFGKIQKAFNKTPTAIGFKFGQRLYFTEFNDTNPFTFGNGQGFFGFDSDGALQGETFPTFRVNTTILDIYAKQMLFNKIILKETIGAEFAPRAAPYDGMTIGITVSMVF